MSEPCTTCGACCATFRVSFYAGETDELPGGTVPAALTEAVSPHLACMRGTAMAPVRCVALAGRVGESVRCSIYEFRSSTCRDLQPGSDNCLAARRRWGLPPLPLVSLP